MAQHDQGTRLLYTVRNNSFISVDGGCSRVYRIVAKANLLVRINPDDYAIVHTCTIQSQ